MSIASLALTFIYIVNVEEDSVATTTTGKLLQDFYDKEDFASELKYCSSEQSKRRQIAQQGCETLSRSNYSFLLQKIPDIRSVWVNRPRQMSMCTPHKVGSQTWRYFFQQMDQRDQGILEGEVNWHEDYQLSGWPEDAQYHKGVQVRHPLERLLSSYRFIFERDVMKSSIAPLNEYIFKTYPDTANTYNSSEFDPFQFVPTFRQFLQFVVHSGEDFGQGDYPVVSHWLPYYLSCNPCHPDFFPDSIIHMETIERDTICYLDASRKIHLEDLANLRHINISPMGHSSSKLIQAEYFGKLDHRDESLLKQVQDKYWPDFLLYGYQLDAYLQMIN